MAECFNFIGCNLSLKRRLIYPLFTDQLQGELAPSPAKADEVDRDRDEGRCEPHPEQQHQQLQRGRGRK